MHRPSAPDEQHCFCMSACLHAGEAAPCVRDDGEAQLCLLSIGSKNLGRTLEVIFPATMLLAAWPEMTRASNTLPISTPAAAGWGE